ncbi:hypothetical protein K474DRAFT_403647 [Panus rudis PR-1116 ss-1]|nr:hypothetical protein K474DRAFT_403647 [Panus rudis PR-1116 ss-1]
MDVSLLSPATLLGGCVLGIYIGVILYGFMVAQATMYFSTFSQDPICLKMTVAFLCLLETIFTVCTIHWLYHLTIIGFGDIAFEMKVPWSPLVSMTTEILMAFLVQSLNLGRLWALSKHNVYLATPIAVLIICRFGTTMTNIVLMIQLRDIAKFEQVTLIQATVTAGAYITVVSDLLTMGGLIYFLRRGRTGFNTRTDGAVRWIIQYIVNTGGLTMVVSIAFAVTFTILRDSLTFWGLWSIMGRLYANSFLGTLNCRQILRRRTGYAVHSTDHMPSKTETILFASMSEYQSGRSISLVRNNR